jgi:isoamylase
MERWSRVDGEPLPLGLAWIPSEQAYNFAVYSRHGTGVELLLFSPADFANPVRRFSLDYVRHKSGRMWHCRLREAELGGASHYAYRVEGPYSPGEGLRFDAAKVLLDPYARAIFFPPGFDRRASMGPGSNAGRAPLGEIDRGLPPFDWGNVAKPRHDCDTVIYEMHVRGFTRRANSGVAPDRRGTFLGVVDKIPYLKELGVTVLELLPIYQFDPEDGGNYWGYMPLGFFAPHRTYSAGTSGSDRLNDFRTMVKALHAADIEVVLDVVYNHTSEVGASGPTYCYRGLDNSTYYLLTAQGGYLDYAGTGNVLRTSHPAVRQLVIDSMRFWVREMQIDGFRFDLASVFTRDDSGVLLPSDPPIISEISSDPCFAGIRLIAEPWDLKAYQLGRAFPGISWAQWNGRFRDDVRSFVKSDTKRVPDLMTRLYGSTDLFPDTLPEAFRPQQSVNYVTCHDGFCLYDLVSYNQKHNEANGHHNDDGTDNNLSWNCGVEGDVGVTPEIRTLRSRQAKNFCALLMLANGTPMFCAGDEFLNTQLGNNNPYNQDNETTWLDWDLLNRNADVFRFFKGMIAFRREHPSIARGRHWRDDIRWFGVNGPVDLSDGSRTLAYLLRGGSEQDRDLYVMISADWAPVTFRIQEGQPQEWVRAVDTSLVSPADLADPGQEQRLLDQAYIVGPRSVVVLLRDTGT